MSALRLSFIIEAIDRATAPVRAVNQRIEKVTEPIRKIRASVNSLVRESGLTRLADQAKVVGEKFEGVKSSILSIGAAGLVAAAGAAAVWLPMKHVIDQGSRINDTAEMLGVSARDFQRLAYALTLDGSSAEDAATALRFMQKNAVDALTGSKEMTTWFRRAGMSADFLKKNLNDPIAMVHKMSDAMAKNLSPAQRIALMQALLGRGGARLVQTLSQGSAALNKFGDEAERLGAVMDDKTVSAMDAVGDMLTRMDRALGGVMTVVTTAALPAITRIATGVTEWAVANRALIATRVTEFVERLVKNLPHIVEVATQIASAVGSAITRADALAQAIGGWENVFKAIAIVQGIQLAATLYQLGAAILALIPPIVSFGIALMATPVGWFIGAVALLAGAAFLIYKNWGPISEFFTDLWRGIVGAATSSIEFIMDKVNSIVAFVKDVILKLDAITPEWVKKWTLPGAVLSAAANAVRPAAAANAVRPAAAANAVRPAVPSALPGRAGAGRADVGGTINIKIDQDGRARVASMRSDNPGVDYDVDTGVYLPTY